jgi:hypothetical protein
MLPCQKDTNLIGPEVTTAGHAYRSMDSAEIVERGACGEAGFSIGCQYSRYLGRIVNCDISNGNYVWRGHSRSVR